MIRDPHSADPNAQAPTGHPDAQVRIDQTNKLAGVQPAKYPDPPAPALGDVVTESTPVAPAPVVVPAEEATDETTDETAAEPSADTESPA